MRGVSSWIGSVAFSSRVVCSTETADHRLRRRSERHLPDDVSEEYVSVTWWDHQAYINSFNVDVVVKNNIFSNGDGCLMRAGGVATNNLSTRAINSLDVGVTSSSKASTFRKASVSTAAIAPTESRSQVSRPKAGLILERNVLANDRSAQAYGRTIRLDGTNCGDNNEPCSVHNVSFRENVIYDWRGGFQTYGMTGPEVGDITVEGNLVQNPEDTQAFLIHLDSGFDASQFPSPRTATIAAAIPDGFASVATKSRFRAGLRPRTRPQVGHARAD